MKAEEIAFPIAEKWQREISDDTSSGDARLMVAYAVREVITDLRAAGLLLEWRTDVENAPRDRVIMLYVSNWPAPRKVHTGEFANTELTPAGWLIHGGINLSARWEPSAWAEIPSASPEQTND